MFELKESKLFYRLEFDEEFLRGKEVSVFENENFKLSNKILNNFLNSQGEFSRVFETLRKGDKYSIKISKNLRKIPYKSISQLSKESISSNRFLASELILPFITKNNFPLKNLMKDYQVKGMNWLKESNGKILADDMGLGKTLQSIMAATSEILENKLGTILIVSPSSLVINWCEEINKWAPYFCVSSFLDIGKSKNEVWQNLFGYNHFVVTNYEQIRELPKTLKDSKLNLIIADEAHKLRKGESKIFKSFHDLNYKKIWALTGTPIEKNARDACHILKIVDPKRDLYDDLKLSYSALRSTLKTHMLRRMKSDIFKDLSDFEYQKIKLELNEEQKNSYTKLLKGMSRSPKDSLSLFGKLREICDFDPTKKTSSKIDFTIDLLEKIKLRNEKCVIFSFWLDPIYLLEKKIKEIYGNDSVVTFTGELDKKERDYQLKKFVNTSAFTFLCSGKVGSEGLNLTSANHAIFFNRWWNPSNNDQARDRIIRIGQKRKAFIYELISSKTIEENISVILDNKKEINEEIIQKMVSKII